MVRGNALEMARKAGMTLVCVLHMSIKDLVLIGLNSGSDTSISQMSEIFRVGNLMCHVIPFMVRRIFSVKPVMPCCPWVLGKNVAHCVASL